MAHRIPHLSSVVTPQRFQLKIHDIAPERIIPNGDRYVVEVIDLDETIELGQLLVVTQDPKLDPKDPMSNPQVEKRGVLAAVVVSKGNGHLLGLNDPAVVLDKHIERVKADVPMWFNPGDVVFVDHNARGRALNIVKRECRIVNQIDVLAKVDGVRLQRKDGEWVIEE